MTELHTYKAQGIGGKEVPSAMLVISKELPEFLTLDQIQSIFVQEAIVIADLLCSTMPQGGLERLIAELMKRKASLLVIPLSKPKEDH